MYRRIAVVYNESAESKRALQSAIQLAKSLDAELETITVMPFLPAYSAFAAVADLSIPSVLNQDRLNFYQELAEKARKSALEQGVAIVTHTVDGSEAEEILSLLRERKVELLVIGLHQRNSYISRLWDRLYVLALGAPCSVLGVH